MTTASDGYTLTFQAADPDDVDLLGGKGAGLARMSQAGLPVPDGFVVSTRASRRYLASAGPGLPAGLPAEITARLAELERRTGKTFGAGPVPLLLSVRSGAPVSMPGMMDTVLNLGLNRPAALAIAAATGDTHFMAELLVRFHRMYGEIVLGALDPGSGELTSGVGSADDAGEVYDTLWSACQHVLEQDTGETVPSDPGEQLAGAVQAVFRSWNSRRARTYREFHQIPHDLGTAVVVQSMVFGNLSADSGSGVVFTRNPVTGDRELFGEFLANSQGEDVVAGLRTPDPISALAGTLPAVYAQLRETCADLERRHGDVLDIEFTVERSRLFFLQVRSAKRTAEAAVRIAADFVRDGTIAPLRAAAMLTADQVRQVQRPGFDPAEVDAARRAGRLFTAGTGACPGQASGILVLDPDRARDLAAQGRRVILARPTTSPADLHGMIAAQGILTATGGTTSHAAVIARALGKACVVGCGAVRISAERRALSAAGRVLAEGDEISLDGTTGEIFTGALAQATPADSNGDLDALLQVAAEAAEAEVFARVTLPADVEPARRAGATGLVTAVDDVLAATGQLDDIVAALLEQPEIGPASVAAVEKAVATGFAPLLAAAGGLETGVRGIDFIADETREMLHQTALITRHPQLSVPLGSAALIEAQLAGLTRAELDAGRPGQVHFTIRHLSDPREAAELRAIGDRVAQRLGRMVRLGGYLASSRGVFNYESLAGASDVTWIEVRVLQAAAFGIPARLLLDRQPLDDYVRRGLLSVDPRSGVDPSVYGLLASVAALAGAQPGCPVGLRLSGPVTEPLVGQLHALGFRRFGVEAHEARPVTLALGQAVLAARGRLSSWRPRDDPAHGLAQFGRVRRPRCPPGRVRRPRCPRRRGGTGLRPGRRGRLLPAVTPDRRRSRQPVGYGVRRARAAGRPSRAARAAAAASPATALGRTGNGAGPGGSRGVIAQQVAGQLLRPDGDELGPRLAELVGAVHAPRHADRADADVQSIPDVPCGVGDQHRGAEVRAGRRRGFVVGHLAPAAVLTARVGQEGPDGRGLVRDGIAAEHVRETVGDAVPDEYPAEHLGGVR
jgi:pyruvate,orthophosphate dikinase